MVPGIYAYKTVFALIMFLQSLNDPGQGLEYMQAVFPECHRVVQRDYPVGCGRYAADIHLQPPGFLAHTTQTEPQVNSFRMDVFWNTIAAYNAATWPVQLLLVAVAAVLTLLLYLRPTRAVRMAMKVFMAALNFWIAGVYYFSLLRSARTLRYSGLVLDGHGLYLDL